MHTMQSGNSFSRTPPCQHGQPQPNLPSYSLPLGPSGRNNSRPGAQQSALAFCYSKSTLLHSQQQHQHPVCCADVSMGGFSFGPNHLHPRSSTMYSRQVFSSSSSTQSYTQSFICHASHSSRSRSSVQPHFSNNDSIHDAQRSSSSSSSSSSSGNSSGDDSSAAAVMVSFLRAYGLQPSDIDKLLHECPQLFLDSSTSSSLETSAAAQSAAPSSSSSSSSSTAGRGKHLQRTDTLTASLRAAATDTATDAAAAADTAAAGSVSSSSSVYEVGRTLLFFHSLGWSHASVMRRIIALYPQLLTKQVDRDILPVCRTLTAMGCSPADLQLLVWEFPRIFTSSNWRRHVRKFQYLGLYGLPPPGHTSSSSSGSGSSSSGSSNGGEGSSGGDGSSSDAEITDSLDRLMHWL